MDNITQKQCRKCGERKTLGDFYENKLSRDKLHHYCKSCMKAYSLDRHKKNPRVYIPTASRRGRWLHRLSNIDEKNRRADCGYCGHVKIRRTSRGGWRCNKGNPRGTSIGEGFKSGVCPICRIYTEKLVFDHDHRTGSFRGWICGKCNTGLGFFFDNMVSLRRAIEYLKQNSPLE